MAVAKTIEERNRLSLWEKVELLKTYVLTYGNAIAFPLAWALLTWPFSPYGRAKSWKRILADKFLLTLVTHLNRRQMRSFLGPTSKHYINFCEKEGLEPVVEEIGTDYKLLWIGPKRNDRALLYLHDISRKAWRGEGNLQESLFWILSFITALMPDAHFPTQLEQLVVAIQHIIDSGVKPENFQLVGDSAGGALIHAVMLHMEHPLDGITKLKLPAPLAGGFMLSLGATLINKDGCLSTNDGKGDFLNGRTIEYWGNDKPTKVPEDWLEGSDKHIKRILISAGEENGAHNDPYTDFLVNEKEDKQSIVRSIGLISSRKVRTHGNTRTDFEGFSIIWSIHRNLKGDANVISYLRSAGFSLRPHWDIIHGGAFTANSNISEGVWPWQGTIKVTGDLGWEYPSAPAIIAYCAFPWTEYVLQLLSPWQYLTPNPRDGVQSYAENARKDVVPPKEKLMEKQPLTALCLEKFIFRVNSNDLPVV
ncbi:hypothetical protein CPB84DRAFT_1747448 [Gymnopilus junonius]|uniref:Alpha/beta hydrolase fold-3 domain-containing protein n=1 Tax=Gymnopilus junonius TaxID=109634 RepID=A0A9P5NQE5_GYMJU|nr:hypothetical protein CPB84DRAFT_1747448 [Gymnopilus junonius]